MSRCDLFLDNYATCYYAGQQIVGHLRCYFESPKSTSGIFVKIKGTAVVQWTESEQRRGSNNRMNTVTVVYRGVHELINEKIKVLYKDGNKIDVPAGEHVFPFTYTLPRGLPSTFNTSPIGKITYIIKGYVDMSFQFDYKAEAEINVVEVFDLNQCPNLLAPVERNKQKSLGCLCWSSGPIDMSLNIPYTGFVPGQSVPLTLVIQNLSRTSISAVTVNIHQRIIFSTTSPHRKTRMHTNKIIETKETGVGAHGERIYELNLQIPLSFTPLNLKTCNLIDVKYTLNVEIVLPGMHLNMNESVDIEIGNVALIDSGYRVQQHPLQSVQSPVEPEADIIGEVDDFAIIGPNTNPTAPPAIPQIGQSTFPSVPSAPSAPSAPPSSSIGEPNQNQPGIGWINPSDKTAAPPSYYDLFEKKD